MRKALTSVVWLVVIVATVATILRYAMERQQAAAKPTPYSAELQRLVSCGVFDAVEKMADGDDPRAKLGPAWHELDEDERAEACEIAYSWAYDSRQSERALLIWDGGRRKFVASYTRAHGLTAIDWN